MLGLQPSEDHITAGEIGSCPGEEWRVLVAESKHAIYFHKGKCEAELDIWGVGGAVGAGGLEECGGGAVHDLRNTVQLRVEPAGIGCENGWPVATEAGPVWPPLDETFRASAEDRGQLAYPEAVRGRYEEMWDSWKHGPPGRDDLDAYFPNAGFIPDTDEVDDIAWEYIEETLPLSPDIVWDYWNKSYFCEARGRVSVCGAGDDMYGAEPTDADPPYHVDPEVIRGWGDVSCPASDYWESVERCNRGPGQVCVPDLDGMTEADAEGSVAAVGLVPRAADPTLVTDPGEVGRVQSQFPAPDTAVNVGATIRFSVGTMEESTGETTGTTEAEPPPPPPPPPPQVEIPNVYGMTEGAACAAIGARGLDCVVGGWNTAITGNPDTVFLTDPGFGTLVEPGSSVQLFLYRWPETQGECESSGGFWGQYPCPPPNEGSECCCTCTAP